MHDCELDWQSWFIGRNAEAMHRQTSDKLQVKNMYMFLSSNLVMTTIERKNNNKKNSKLISSICLFEHCIRL